ncbi:MAG: right-handed parallel beta-helix repeat-containing protein [Alphaproteobacteria bacterium]|nr:right-handed parallel beta-helix repeat-containing protein [Alphaproteobacteria bacterium]
MWLVLSVAFAIEVQVGADKPYTTIGDALAAPDVTVILVDPGAYDVGFGLQGRTVEIRGTSTRRTRLRVSNDSVEVGGDEANPGHLLLTDLTLQKTDDQEEALYIGDFGTVTLERVSVRGRRFDQVQPIPDFQDHRAVIRVRGGTLEATTTDFVEATSYSGAAHIDAVRGSVLLDDCVLVLAWSEADLGGAIYVESADLTIRGSVVADNEARRGAAVFASQSTVTIEGSTIAANRGQDAGAISMRDASTLTLTGSELWDNTSGNGTVSVETGAATIATTVFRDNHSVGSGGGLQCLSAACDVSDSRFERNVSDTGGGGVHLGSATGRVVRTEICDNQAPVDGGGVRFADSSVAFTNNLVLGNQGGGVAVASGTATIQHVALVANHNPTGAAVRGSNFLLIDTLVAGHDDGQTLVAANNPANATLSNNGYHENTLPAQGGVQDLGGNESRDPLLHVWPPVGCRLDDYRLRPESPLIGAGSNQGEDIGAFSGPEAGVGTGDADEDGIDAAYDCDDSDPELGLPVLVFPNDRDLDGYADERDPGTRFEACPSPGRVTARGDCDDASATIYPNAPEDVGGSDRDCDTWVDPAVHPSRACAVAPVTAGWLALFGLLASRRR